MSEQSLANAFASRFGAPPARTYFSPGRVNLIGEYTDFNGGHVLPAAIDLGTYYAARPNGTRSIRVYSQTLDQMREVSCGGTASLVASGHWSDYVAGIVAEFDKRGCTGDGIDIYVTNDLPQNAGLSSSASFTTGLAFLLNDLWSCELERVALALSAQGAENHFVGVQCGIMDQFAVALGEADHCIFLNCNSLDYELVPMHTENYEIVIIDSRVPRKLASSAYNDRRAECEEALACLKQTHDIRHLCDAGLEQVESCESLKARPIAYKRARHVVSENERVKASVRALRQGDLDTFGRLMQSSHRSLRDDFEASCPELDMLVETALGVDGVPGSRMTGAGFGGCTVSLVRADAVDAFTHRIKGTYSEQTPYEARVFRCRASDGVKRLS